MKVSCEIIRDLLPLYCDGVCSEETRKWVEAHIATCPECAAVLKKMRVECQSVDASTGVETGDMFQKAAKKWRKTMLRAFWRGAAAVAVVFLLVSAGNYGLCKANLIPADPALVDTTAYSIQGDPEHLAVVLRTNDGYAKGTVTAERDGSGNLYLSVFRPVLKGKKNPENNLQILYTVDIQEAKAVYYGQDGDNRLLWDSGRDLPEISYQEIAKLHGDTAIRE